MTYTVSDLTSSQAVKGAIAECDAMGRQAFLKKHGFRYSRLYPLVHWGKLYDPKAIVGVAIGKQHGKPLRARDFSGGTHTVVPVLERLGFTVRPNGHPLEELARGEVYFRKALTSTYGGQLQRGTRSSSLGRRHLPNLP